MQLKLWKRITITILAIATNLLTEAETFSFDDKVVAEESLAAGAKRETAAKDEGDGGEAQRHHLALN